MCLFFFFFFSSRRRHTRSLCDWSSDVCSSDLTCGGPFAEGLPYLAPQGLIAPQVQLARQVQVGSEFLPFRLVGRLPERRPQPASTVRCLAVVHPDLQPWPEFSSGSTFA